MRNKNASFQIRAKARLVQSANTIDPQGHSVWSDPPLRLNSNDAYDPAGSGDQSLEIEETLDQIGRPQDGAEMLSSLDDPISDGQAFDTLNDGEPEDGEEPMVQELTHDDGGVEEDPTKNLLNDDLPIPGSPTSGN